MSHTERLTLEMIETLLNEGENATRDYKREQYPFESQPEAVKCELLKDIMAFATGTHNKTARILLGVDEDIGARASITGIKAHINDNCLQQFINSKTNRTVTFAYHAYTLEEKHIAIITIPPHSIFVYLLKPDGRKRSTKNSGVTNTRCNAISGNENDWNALIFQSSAFRHLLSTCIRAREWHD